MKIEEAKKVLSILSNADNGCPVCVEDLVSRFAYVFPEFSELANTYNPYHKNYDKNNEIE